MPETSTEPVVDPAVPVSEPVAVVPTPEPPVIEGDEPHPLSPEGDRFKQVWARAKGAEEREKRLEGELQREREERIRYEERLKAQDATPAHPKEPVYTRVQLEEFIANGQLTRAQAEDYNEARVRREIVAESDKQLDAKLAAIRRTERVQTDIDRYKVLVPNIMQGGTVEKDKVTTEFRYMVDVLGMPQTLSTELAAARAAFGDLGVLERSRAAVSATRDNRETTVETTNAGGRASSTTKDPLTTLTPRQKAHYEKMIQNGRYPKGWEDVRAELNYVPGL